MFLNVNDTLAILFNAKNKITSKLTFLFFKGNQTIQKVVQTRIFDEVFLGLNKVSLSFR